MFRVLEKATGNKRKISKLLNFIMIFLAIFLIIFFLATIVFWYIDFEKDIVFKWVGFIFLFSVFIKILHHIFFHQDKAVFTGNLAFKDSEIVILEKNYPLDQISKIRIKGNDIKGEFTGLRSQGINNELIVNLENGDDLSYYFEQTEENNLKDMLILKEYVYKGKLTQLNYDSIIANTNYY